MGYVSKEYLATQLTNLATRIATVFAKKTDVPTKVSELTNDSGYITGSVDNLVNYYKKSETYTKTEIVSMIAGGNDLSLQVVESLPEVDISAKTIYLVPKETQGADNVYTEYIYVDGSWEIIGDTSTNLEGYVTADSLETTLAGYLKTTDTESGNIDFSTYFA